MASPVPPYCRKTSTVMFSESWCWLGIKASVLVTSLILNLVMKLFFFVCSFRRITTRQGWTMAPLISLPQTVSHHMEGWKRRKRRSSPLMLTSIWSQTCWSPSAARPGWPGRLLTCCRVWVYTYHPTLIRHKGPDVDSDIEWGHIWHAQTRSRRGFY